MALSSLKVNNSAEYLVPKNNIVSSFNYREILKHNIMLNSELAKIYHFIQKINFNGIDYDFEFKIATKPQEIKKVLRLRFLSYSNEGYIDPNFFSEGLEYDKYDINSAMFLVRNLETNKIHACVRLVLDSYTGLPLEEFVNINDFRSENKVISEISRLISYPKGQKLINRAILAFAYRFASALGITHLVGFGRWEKLIYYESIGLSILEPLRKVKYNNIGNGHKPSGEFYINVLDFKNLNFVIKKLS